jgi:hypothetical protein
MDRKEQIEEAQKRKKDVERVRAFQIMVKSDGWQHYQELLNGKVAGLTQNIFDPPSEASTRVEDHKKGTIFGLLYARDLPSITIAAHEASEPASEEK